MMAPSMAIAVADPADAPAIARLHTHSWRDTYARWLPADLGVEDLYANRLELWTTRFRMTEEQRDLVLKATAGQDIIGFVCLTTRLDPPHGRLLGNLHVRADWKRHGLGRQLLREAARAARPSGAMHLWVICENTAACRFYDALGGVTHDLRQETLVPGMVVDEIRYVWSGPSLSSLAG
jgi:predicted N-acetyltransferase YhbS